MANRNIFVHIGTHKTGSTSIQTFLDRNYNLLKQKGFIVPRCMGTKNHAGLSIYSTHEENSLLLNRSKNWTKNNIVKLPELLLDEISPESQHSIVFSNEALCRQIKSPIHFAKLKSIFEPFTNHSIKIVVYIRRQDQYLLSAYSTLVKRGSLDSFSANQFNPELCYDELLDRWALEFGKGNIICKIYDRKKLVKQDVVSDFMASIGIEDNEDFVYPKNDNSSLDTKTIRFLQLFNQFCPWYFDTEGKNENKLRMDIAEVLEKYSTEKRMKLSINQIKSILLKYKKSNEKLKQRYFPEIIGDLFDTSDLAKEKNNTVYSEPQLTIEEAIEIAAKLWTHQNQRIIKLQNEKATYKNQ